mgnify:FL=1
MDKITFLGRMKASREALEAAVAALSPEQVERSAVDGEWSPKDVLAHITWHEQQMIGVIEQMALVGSAWWNLPTDERNAHIYALNQERAWEDVLAEAQQVYPCLYQALAALPEAAFQDASLYREMPADWAPWQVFAGNTFEHYEQHLEALRRFTGG